ncbi:hypothetical protein pb186bvf_011282 [Paramecium bursaria]
MISRIPLRLLKAIKPFQSARIIAPFCSELIKVNDKLVRIVDKELKYEKSNYEIDQTAQDFIDSKGFTLIDNEHDHKLELSRSFGDVQLLITFQSRQPNQGEDEGQEDNAENVPQTQQGNQQQINEEEEQPQDYADFTVYLTKSNGSTLVYECSSFGSEIQINGVSITKDVQAHKKIPTYQRGLDSYEGPEFSTLDERLQQNLLEYLKNFGVNEELAAFIEHYSLDKEQRLYMRWLEQLKTFLKN